MYTKYRNQNQFTLKDMDKFHCPFKYFFDTRLKCISMLIQNTTYRFTGPAAGKGVHASHKPIMRRWCRGILTFNCRIAPVGTKRIFFN